MRLYGRASSLLGLTVAAALALPVAAHACSPVSPFELQDTTLLSFIARAGVDTAVAGFGSIKPVNEQGHYGQPGLTARGQRFAISRLGPRTAKMLPAGTREVLLVPWDYSALCEPVVSARPARWLLPGTAGLFRAQLRAREHWVDGMPTLDLMSPHMQPYTGRSNPANPERGTAAGTMVSPEALLPILDELPARGARGDTTAALTLWRALTRDTANAGKYPVLSLVNLAVYQFQEARELSMRYPFAGMWRMEIRAAGRAPRVFFLQMSDRPTGGFHGALSDGPSPTGAAPLRTEPFGYYVAAASAPTPDGVPRSCRESSPRPPGVRVAHTSIAGEPPRRGSDGTLEWRSDIDHGLLTPGFLPSESTLRDSLVRVERARGDSLLRAGVFTELRNWNPQWTTRIVAKPGAPMRLEGSLTVAHVGTFTVRGERISDVPFRCGS